MNFNLTAGQITAYKAKIGVYKVEQTYRVTINSRFILTQSQVKKALGLGFTVLSIELEKDCSQLPITNVDSACMNIVNTGYRSLARAHHPDLGGDPDIMRILNQSKKELTDLLRSL